MITYAEACKQVGYDPKAVCPHQNTVIWYAYKAGSVVGCTDKASALAISPNVESVVKRSPYKDDWAQYQLTLSMRANQVFFVALREECKDLSDQQWEACINFTNHLDFDARANEVLRLANFVKAIL